MDIELIALDMDGTVLDSKSEISVSTITAISKTLDQNIHVVFCTGRTLSELKMLLRYLPKARYFICSNGATIIDIASEKTIYRDLLNNNKVRRIYRLSFSFDTMFEIYANYRIYLKEYCWNHPEEYGAGFLKTHMEESRTPVADLSKFLESYYDPVEKLNIFFKNIEEKKCAWDMYSKLDVALTMSIHKNIEINSITSNKGKALTFLCQYLGIRSTKTVAIGDSINDIPMMQAAGFKIAMGNAISDVKRIADAVTDSNDGNGVAAALYRYVL